ncbi:MAG TPA: DUF1707 domain-containing protein, partial [Acidimicrobiales bacterium]|nr:DUF1707 domain-containing protein [Acidimicrobiales bacterium]
QRTVDELRRHCAAGRIDMDEYGRRVEKAMASERLEQLDAVLSDLPILRIADPSAGGEANGRGRRDPRSKRGGRLLGEIPSLGAGGERPLGEGTLGRGGGRAAATVTAILVVLVVVVAVVLVITASWAWAAVLVAGWVVGLLQAAVARRRSG